MLYARNPGGAPANVAVAASRLGAHTAFIGKAGKDMHGKLLKSVLEKENVDTKGMLLDENYFTTLAFVEVSETGERTFSFARKPGADTRMEKEEIDVDILDKTHIFHVGSLSLTEQPARDTTHYAIRRAKEKGSIILYDSNYRVFLWKDEEIAKKQMRSLVPYVDIMKISDEETKLLTDKESPEEATETTYEILLHWSAKEAVFKILDEEGIDFRKNLTVQILSCPAMPDHTEAKGEFSLYYHLSDGKTGTFPVHYETTADFVLTYAFRKL